MNSHTKLKFIFIGFFCVFSSICIVSFIDVNIISNPNLYYRDNVCYDKEYLKLSDVSGKIHIDNNWTAAKAAGICTGLGTISSPYVIEDLIINGGGLGNCIQIGFSDAYFRVENCTLYNSGGSWGNAGINFDAEISNGKVVNNTVYNSYNGIFISDAENIEISRNIVHDNVDAGIASYHCNNIIISENTVTDNTNGIVLSDSSYYSISNNEVSYNSYLGIGLFDSARNMIEQNLVTNNHIGISIDEDSYCNEVKDNTVNSNDTDFENAQGACPDIIPIEPFLLLIVIGLIIGSSGITIFILIRRKNSAKRKFPLEKSLLVEDNFEDEILIDDIPFERESFESKTIIRPEKVSQEEKILEDITQIPAIKTEEKITQDQVTTSELNHVKEEISEEEISQKKWTPNEEDLSRNEEIVDTKEKIKKVEPKLEQKEEIILEDVPKVEKRLKEGFIAESQGIIEKLPIITTLSGHLKGVTAVAFSPDGNYLVSGSKDKTIKVWELDTGKVLRTIEGHKKIVNSVAVSNDGKYVVSGSNDKTVKVWDFISGELIYTFEGHKFYVLAIALSSDNKYIVSSSIDKEIRVWNLSTRTHTRTISGHGKEIVSVDISPDNEKFVSGSTDKTIKIWDIESGELINTMNHRKGVTSVLFSTDGKYIISGSNDKTIKVWEVATGNLVKFFKGHRFSVMSVAISPDNTYIVSSSFDKEIRVWNFSTEDCLKTFIGHKKEITTVAISPINNYIASGSSDKMIKIWQF